MRRKKYSKDRNFPEEDHDKQKEESFGFDDRWYLNSMASRRYPSGEDSDT